MTATSPNRIAPYLREPTKPLPPPSTPEAREALLTDAVFAAVAALQGLLTHPDPKVVMKAAEMILNLETTRQRHGRGVIGTATPRELECGPHQFECGGPPPHTPPVCAGGQEPLVERAEHTPRAVNRANPLDVFVEQVRKELQAQEDAEGTGVIVGREQAEECARFIQANMHRTPLFDPTPADRRCHEDMAGGPGTRKGAVSGHRVPNVGAHSLG